MRYLTRFIIFCIILSNALPAFSETEINSEDLQKHVQFLASDETEGRKPGNKGGRIAAEYIQGYMRKFGLKPLFKDYFQTFEVIKSVDAGEGNILEIDGFSGKVREDFIPYSFSSNEDINAEAAFCGYGFEIAEDSIKWDDFADIDIKGKWAVILRGDPESDKTESPFAQFIDERQKVISAKDKGAVGVIFVSGPKFSEKDELTSMFYDKSSSGAGIPVVNVKRTIADKILSKSGKTTGELENLLIEKRQPMSFLIDTKLRIKTDVVQVKATTQNIAGIIEGSDPQLRNEYIVIGAHYDHLGFGGEGSGSRMPDTNAIHYGADDNASGVSGVLELAEYFSAAPGKRTLVFVAFGAEEMGLLGSKYFTDNSPVDLKKVKAMINMDMLGRLNADTKTVIIGGTGTSSQGEEILNGLADEIDFKLSYSPEGYGPSDHAAFYGENIPVFFISTGAHEDYHTPFDQADRLDFKSEEKIVKFVSSLVAELDKVPEMLTFREAGPKVQASRRTRLKVTLGIMPDFTRTDIEGLGVGGVRKGGPADGSGMLKGDIIVSINGEKVKDIYEYMHRLKKLKAGEMITVDVLREGKKKVLIVQL